MAGLYIHVPFCAGRCVYCDFFSSTDMTYQEAYVSALLCELEAKCDYLQGEQIDTLYLGGGTPSCLNVRELASIIRAVYRFFPVSEKPEITLEANPDDLSGCYVASLQSLPVNRLSIGVQSFSDRELNLLNRRHTAQEAIEAVGRCRDAGFSNISIDLMYGLPEQTTSSWLASIDHALALDVAHISAYTLTYESGTPLYKMWERNEICPIDDDLCEQFFRLLTHKLTDAGFVQYEISNFAKRTNVYPEGRISIHNSSYWNGTHYLGVGPAAHSYDGKSRSWNVSSVSGYIRMMKETPDCFDETEWLDERTRYNDFIITRLRTVWGISLEELNETCGAERLRYFLGKSAPFFRSKMLKNQGGFVKITSDGIFVSDAIMRDLIAF